MAESRRTTGACPEETADCAKVPRQDGGSGQVGRARRLWPQHGAGAGVLRGQGLGPEHASRQAKESGGHPAGGEDFRPGSRTTKYSTDRLQAFDSHEGVGTGRGTEENDPEKRQRSQLFPKPIPRRHPPSQHRFPASRASRRGHRTAALQPGPEARGCVPLPVRAPGHYPTPPVPPLLGLTRRSQRLRLGPPEPGDGESLGNNLPPRLSH